MKSDEIRSTYLEFFREREHVVERSDKLVPGNDPTLLFTSAGMVQFKAYYSGDVPVPYRRATTAQKCLRAGGKANDLDEVGKTSRHLTFFEMMGNFSFGDYFKREAIAWGWKYSTEFLKIPAEDIWISVYEDDDEAYDIWEKEIGVPASKIVRLGAKENFWGPAGDTGACGPCSELHLDRAKPSAAAGRIARRDATSAKGSSSSGTSCSPSSTSRSTGRVDPSRIGASTPAWDSNAWRPCFRARRRCSTRTGSSRSSRRPLR